MEDKQDQSLLLGGTSSGASAYRVHGNSVGRRVMCCARCTLGAVSFGATAAVVICCVLVGSRHYSFSQFGQDAFVLAVLKDAHDGLFVDVGASDGVTNSNSFLLENWFGWRGICVEPGPRSTLLWLSRPRCFKAYEPVSNVDGRAVAYVAGARTAEHSRIVTSADAAPGSARVSRTTTVTLATLVASFQRSRGRAAGERLTFSVVSIDAEGHDCEVLKGFPLAGHSIRVLIIEGNIRVRHCVEAHLRSSNASAALVFVGTHVADLVFTEPGLAARARALLDAPKTSADGAWKHVRGLYASCESFVHGLSKSYGIDVEQWLRAVGLR